MQNLPEEVLLPPKPYVALLGDMEYVEVLAVALKTSGLKPGGPNSMYMRYEPHTLSSRFAPRQRSHADHEYPSYIPAGIIRSNWMKKHQDEVPAVLVSSATPLTGAPIQPTTLTSSTRIFHTCEQNP